MYKKITSKMICLGFTWGIFSWIDCFKNNKSPSFISAIPVFLSIRMGNILLKEMNFIYDKNIFLLTILFCGFIGYLFSIVIKIFFSIFTEE